MCYNRENKRKGNDYMKVIVCVDDNNGMMFNNRRQSRDRILIEDVVKNVVGGNLLMAPYSEPLFKDSNMDICLSESLLDEANPEDYCFIENISLLPYSDRIDELIIYRWNRTYPADMHLDIDPAVLSMKLVSTTEFAGSSHEKITKELYKR